MILQKYIVNNLALCLDCRESCLLEVDTHLCQVVVVLFLPFAVDENVVQVWECKVQAQQGFYHFLPGRCCLGLSRSANKASGKRTAHASSS